MYKVLQQRLHSFGYEGHANKKGLYITYDNKRVSPYFKTTKAGLKWAHKNYKRLKEKGLKKGGEE